MMMCIGGVSDFEAQLTASVERFVANLAAEDRELAVRSGDWLRDRGVLYRVFGYPIEPPRPYSHGRRFIPAWLAADRERCMWSDDGMKTADVWQFRWNSTVILDIDPTVMRMDGDDAMPNESMTRTV